MSTSTVKDSFTVAKGWRKRGGGRLKPMNTTQTKVRSTEEALKLALEALENLINQHYAETITNDDLEKADNAITAIKEALMSLCDGAQQNPQGVSNGQVEPTCWITPDGEGFRMRMTPPVNDVPLGWTPLFDHPPVPTPQPELLFEVDGETLTATQIALLNLYEFQQATGCDTAAEFLAQPKEPEQEPVAKVVSTAPERIWLDLGFEPSDEDEISFNDLVDATWSHDNATGYGIEYVRADIAAHGIKERT